MTTALWIQVCKHNISYIKMTFWCMFFRIGSFWTKRNSGFIEQALQWGMEILYSVCVCVFMTKKYVR